MTTLEKIVKKAQALKKSYPNKFAKWTDYVKEASKEFKKLPDRIKKKTNIGNKSKIYKIGDTFKGKPNADYSHSWQLYKKSISYVINDKTNKIVSIEKTPYEAIKKRDILNTNFKLDFKVYPAEFYKNQNMNGTKKTTKKKAVYKDNVKNVSDLIKKKIKSKKLIMPHGYQVSKSKLNGNSIGSINEKYITELNNINKEIENAKQNINSLKTLKLNDLKNFKLGFKQELLDRYINRTKYLKKQLIQIKKQIK